MSDSGCNGDCCVAFYLPFTIHQFRKKAKEQIADGEFIADMIIPLTPKEANIRRKKFVKGSLGKDASWKNRGHYFACRHWDEETRKCKVYDKRPSMCRKYPYGRGCIHGCSCIGQTNALKENPVG